MKFFIRTQGDKRTIWSRDITKMFWENLTAKAQLENGEIVILGNYESYEEAQHVSDDFFFLIKFIRRYIFPEFGYYKKYYLKE